MWGMANINLPLDDELLARIDWARQTEAGTIPRVAWIRAAIVRALRPADAPSEETS